MCETTANGNPIRLPKQKPAGKNGRCRTDTQHQRGHFEALPGGAKEGASSKIVDSTQNSGHGNFQKPAQVIVFMVPLPRLELGTY